jgi:hypothetical protein
MKAISGSLQVSVWSVTILIRRGLFVKRISIFATILLGIVLSTPWYAQGDHALKVKISLPDALD